MVSENPLSNNEFRSLCDSLIKINSGYDFGPFQDPNYLFPTWNFAVYNDAIKKGEKLYDYGHSNPNPYILMGGSAGLGHLAPPLSFVKDLGRENCMIYGSGARTYGLYSYAFYLLKNLGILHPPKDPVEAGWLSMTVSVTTRFAEMCFNTHKSNATGSEKNLVSSTHDISKMIAHEFRQTMPVTSMSLAVDCLKNQVNNLKELGFGNDDMLRNIPGRAEAEKLIEDISKRIDQENLNVTTMKLRDFKRKGIIKDGELEKVKEFIHNVHKSTGDKSGITWEPDNVPIFELSASMKVPEIPSNTLQLFKPDPTELQKLSTLVHDKQRLAFIANHLNVLQKFEFSALRSLVHTMNPEVFTLEITELLIALYPQPSEIRRLNKHLKNNEGLLTGLTDVDKMMVECLKLPNILEVLNAHKIALTFADVLEDFTTPMKTVIKFSEAILHNQGIRAIINSMKAVAEQEFGQTNYIFYAHQINQVATHPINKFENIIDRVLAVLTAEQKASAAIDHFLSISAAFETAESMDLNALFSNVKGYINSFKKHETNIAQRCAESAMTPSVMRLYKFFKQSGETVEVLAKMLMDTASSYGKLCRYLCMPDPFSCNPFAELLKLRPHIIAFNNKQVRLKSDIKKWNSVLTDRILFRSGTTLFDPDHTMAKLETPKPLPKEEPRTKNVANITIDSGGIASMKSQQFEKPAIGTKSTPPTSGSPPAKSPTAVTSKDSKSNEMTVGTSPKPLIKRNIVAVSPKSPTVTITKTKQHEHDSVIPSVPPKSSKTRSGLSSDTAKDPEPVGSVVKSKGEAKRPSTAPPKKQSLSREIAKAKAPVITQNARQPGHKQIAKSQASKKIIEPVAKKPKQLSAKSGSKQGPNPASKKDPNSGSKKKQSPGSKKAPNSGIKKEQNPANKKAPRPATKKAETPVKKAVRESLPRIILNKILTKLRPRPSPNPAPPIIQKKNPQARPSKNTTPPSPKEIESASDTFGSYSASSEQNTSNSGVTVRDAVRLLEQAQARHLHKELQLKMIAAKARHEPRAPS